MRTMTLSKSATFPNSHFYYGEVISIQSNLPNVIFHYMIKIYPFNDRKGSEVISVYFCQKKYISYIVLHLPTCPLFLYGPEQ